MMPQKFQNKTNGVTPRRWLAWCNPALAALITEALGGDQWINDTARLAGLRKFADDKGFQAKWRAIKLANKERLAAKIKARPFCHQQCRWRTPCAWSALPALRATRASKPNGAPSSWPTRRAWRPRQRTLLSVRVKCKNFG